MVSAPTGRVCNKKNAQAVHVTMEIRIVTCYTIAIDSFIECIRSSSCFCRTRSLCCISSPARHSGRPGTSFYRALPFAFLFLSFERHRCGAAIPQVTPAPNVTLVTHSSMFKKHDGKVACVALCHRPNQTSIYVCKRGCTYSPDCFS